MATPWLDGHHVAFGIVVDGMDVLDAIEACGTASGKPTQYTQYNKVMFSEVRIIDCGIVEEENEDEVYSKTEDDTPMESNEEQSEEEEDEDEEESKYRYEAKKSGNLRSSSEDDDEEEE